MERREQILRTALDCFLERGFHGTSTREICRRAGISSGLIFHYFPTKEAIYEELVRLALTSFQPAFEPTQDALDSLEHTVSSILTMLANDRASAKIFLFVNQAQYQRGVSTVVDELFTEHDAIRAFQPIIEAGQASGQLRPGNPHALTVALFTALQGLAEEVAINPDQPLPEADWYLDLVRLPRSQP